ncbi:MAG: glycosyltransferase family 2 protein [Bacteroidota bacterium]
MEREVATPRVAIIIPAFNEKTDVLRATIQAWKGEGRTIILVDDGSQPAVSPTIADVILLIHPANRGQGAAIKTGMAYALAAGIDYCITVDADGQHPPRNFDPLLRPLITHQADIVFGSRFLTATAKSTIPPLRMLVLQLAVYYNNFITGLKMTDAHNGLRALNRKAMLAMELTENRMAHASEMPLLSRLKGLRWTEVAVTIHYTDYARQKGQSLWRAFPLSWRLLRLKMRYR